MSGRHCVARLDALSVLAIGFQKQQDKELRMQELISSIKAAEADGNAGLAACVFLPRVPARRLSLFLDVRALVAVEQKELVCVLHLYSSDGAPLVVREPSWPFSSSLRAPYHYLSAIGDDKLLKLKSFASAEPFGAAVIHLLPWKRRFAIGEVTLQRCVAAERITLNGRHFMQYHDLPALEKACD